MWQPFRYQAPKKVTELLHLLQEEGPQARLLAGGTDVMAEMRFAKTLPRVVIDVKRVDDFPGLYFDPAEGLTIGATTTVASLLQSGLIAERFPLIRRAASLLGSPQLRNRATVTGNLCTASPCADMGVCLLALDARLELRSTQGSREVPLKDFFIHVKRTVIRPDEVVRRIIVSKEMVDATGGMEKLKRIKGHDLALASVALVKHEGRIHVSIGSCAPTPVVLPTQPESLEVQALVELAMGAIHPIDDVRAGADYRRFMVGVYIEKLMASVVSSGKGR